MKEKTKRQLACIGTTSYVVLKTIGTVGLVVSAFAFPGLAHVLGALEPKRRPYMPPCRVRGILGGLRARGLIELTTHEDKRFYTLSAGGQSLLAAYELKQKRIRRPLRWDNKWRLVLFDVKEKRRPSRDGLRATLKNLGFIRLQDSVWIYPFDCEEIIELARTAHATRFDALYIVTNRFPLDEKYVRAFNLEKHRKK